MDKRRSAKPVIVGSSPTGCSRKGWTLRVMTPEEVRESQQRILQVIRVLNLGGSLIATGLKNAMERGESVSPETMQTMMKELEYGVGTVMALTEVLANSIGIDPGELLTITEIFEAVSSYNAGSTPSERFLTKLGKNKPTSKEQMSSDDKADIDELTRMFNL